ncbi:cystatin C (amyloid angiopathy and cerebral hemorrhage) [Stigmatopora argus]
MIWRVAFLLVLGIVCAEAIGHLVGGLVDVDLDRESDAQTALSFAIKHHNVASNDIYLRQMSHLIRAQKQVVSGIMYHFTVKLAKTSCRKNSNEQCGILQDPVEAQPYECTFKVWSRPWLNQEPKVIQMCKNDVAETSV